MRCLRSGYEGLEGHLGTIWGLVWRVYSEVILGPILDPFWTLSEKPHRIRQNCLHTAVGRA